MYLFGGIRRLDANGGDDASVIYHEYAHGLSNRLVTGGTGCAALRGFHARSMGEGWSDFYAMDYLVAQGLDEPRRSRTSTARSTWATTSPAATFIPASVPRASTAPTTVSVTAPSDPRPRRSPMTSARAGHAAPGRLRPRRHGHRHLVRPRVPRRRRDLGADAVGPPPGARRREARAASSPTACGCRRPTRRCSTCATRSSRPTRSPSAARTDHALERVRGARHGLARRGRRRRRHDADAELERAAQPTAATVSGRVTDAVTGAGVAGAYIHLRRERRARRLRHHDRRERRLHALGGRSRRRSRACWSARRGLRPPASRQRRRSAGGRR